MRIPTNIISTFPELEEKAMSPLSRELNQDRCEKGNDYAYGSHQKDWKKGDEFGPVKVAILERPHLRRFCSFIPILWTVD